MEMMVGKIRDLQDTLMSSNRNILVVELQGDRKEQMDEKIKLFLLSDCCSLKTTSREADTVRVYYPLSLLLVVC